jgi:hypothetical protein
MTSSEVPLEPRVLEELQELHGLSEEWTPRFAADLVVCEQKAEEYEQLGYEVEIYPHPDDVSRGQLPDDHDRCVVYTRPPDHEEEGGGLVDESLL